LRRGKV